MGDKRGWEDSSRTPDWIDLEGMMRALEGLHSAHVAVVVSPAGTGFGTGVSVTASAIFERLPGSSLPATVTATKVWPCATHRTLAAHAYSLLHKLDFEISKVYKQDSLWK